MPLQIINFHDFHILDLKDTDQSEMAQDHYGDVFKYAEVDT